jgi:hypothetical protein
MMDSRVCLTGAATLIGIVVLTGLACVRVGASGEGQAPLPDLARLEAMTARFAPADLGADLQGLPAGERQALSKLIEAARVVDAIYLRQVWAGNEALLLELLEDASALGRARLRYFMIDKGPWSRLDHDAPFLPGVPVKPGGANFYPAGATKAEVEAWMAGLPPAERARAAGFFTTIRRGPDGRFTAVAYSLEYQGELARAAELLREAAGLTAEPSLVAFLKKRADAFVSNDYYDSDVAWMELDARLEPTIGPYEVYEDEWFNAKAAFEAFIAVRDEGETRKLAGFASELQWLEDRLPMNPEWRNTHLGALAPIRVVDLVFSAGDGNHGVQTAAYNLPNDERIVAEKGTKRIMLRNTQEAKFQKVLVPISRVALPAGERENVAFDAFFTHILMHELTLTREILTIEAEGSEAKARALLERQGVVRPEVQRVLDRLRDVPVDIAPRFVTAEELTAFHRGE